MLKVFFIIQTVIGVRITYTLPRIFELLLKPIWWNSLTRYTRRPITENQVRMWDNWEYKFVLPGCPALAQRVSVGHSGITGEYS